MDMEIISLATQGTLQLKVLVVSMSQIMVIIG